MRIMAFTFQRMFQLRPPKSACVRIGRDGRGNWVALDREGASGGLFVSHDAARAFALVENGNREDAIEVIEALELKLDMGAGDERWWRNAGRPAEDGD
jgi:hypothetical protein